MGFSVFYFVKNRGLPRGDVVASSSRIFISREGVQMRKVRMRKMIALLLAAVMAFSLVIVTGAAEETDTPETSQQTATLNVECTSVTADGVATFKVSIAAPASGVAALQFTLTPVGMTYESGTLADLASVFKPSIMGVPNGDYDFTVQGGVGKYIAYGGDVKEIGRYLSGTTTLLTIQYKLNDGVDTGTLKVSDFKACQSGDKAIGDNGYICTAPESVEAKPTATPMPTVIKGDVNGDGLVNIADVIRLLKHVNKSEVFTDASHCDIDGDESVNISDVIRLLNHVNKSQPLE